MHTPAYIRREFRCPHCRVVCEQEWWFASEANGAPEAAQDPGVAIVTCTSCKGFSVWVGAVMVYPPDPTPLGLR